MSLDAREVPAGGATVPPAGPDHAPVAAVSRKSEGGGAEEEVELWWGSYSGWTMTPSFAVCALLTGLIFWTAWYFVPRGWVQLSALGASGVIWLVQLARWGRRYFGYNYRLTTRRLFSLRGVRRLTVTVIELTGIGRVRVKRSWLERQFRVGRVIVEKEGAGMPLVLQGVHEPQRTADLIWEASKRARG